MNKNEKLSITIQSLFNFADIMYRLFVSVYIYMYTSSVITATIYTLIRMTVIPILMALSIKVVRKHSLAFLYTLSFLLQTLSLIWALYATELFKINMAFVYISAFLMGAGEGLYYFATNTSQQIVTSNESRPLFYKYLGILKTITALLAPIVANRLIVHSSSDLIAYRKLLILLVILYLFISIISLNFKVKAKVIHLNLKRNIDLNNEAWRDTLIATFFSTIRESLNWSLLAIVVSDLALSGKLYSTFQTIFQFLSLILYFFLTKALSKRYFKYSFLIGTLMYSLCTIVLVISGNLLGCLIYGLMNTINEVFFNSAYNIVVSKIIDEHKNEVYGRIIVREIAYYAGRLPAMLFIVWCYKHFPNDVYYKIPFVIYAICPFITYKMMMKHAN